MPAHLFARHPNPEVGLDAVGALGGGRPKVSRRQAGMREGGMDGAAQEQGIVAAVQADGGVQRGERLPVAAQPVQGAAAPHVGLGALGVQPGRLAVRGQGPLGVALLHRLVARVDMGVECHLCGAHLEIPAQYRRAEAGDGGERRPLDALRGLPFAGRPFFPAAHARGPGGRDLCGAARRDARRARSCPPAPAAP